MEKKHQRTPKEKRRNLERRKEKSRDAARCRRSKEQEIFTDLFSMLPLSKSECISHLDKASIIRIAISYLKVRAIIQSIPVLDNDANSTKVCNADSLFLNALEGFLLVTTTDGDIVFISENVNRYLGLSQVDILGQSIYELSHPCDHAEIKEMLSTKDLSTQKSHFLRMKCTLTSKGRNVNIKSASYKVIQYSGRMIERQSNLFSNNKQSEDIDEKELNVKKIQYYEKKLIKLSSFHFVAVGEPISHPANIEIPLGRNTFLSKHSLDMKFTYADERIIDFFGYNPNTLIKKSLFEYHHAQDSLLVKDSFKSLFHKGQSQTERYRFLASGGGYAWVLTQATVIYNNNTLKPQSVVCVNFVISGIENKDEIYSLCQLENYHDHLSSSLCESVQVQNNEENVTSTAVKDGYLLENSPQRLIEKLSIKTTKLIDEKSTLVTIGTVADTAKTTTDKNDIFHLVDESSSLQHYCSISPTTSVQKNTLKENPKLLTQILPSGQDLNDDEFLINSASVPALKSDHTNSLPTLSELSSLLLSTPSASSSSSVSVPVISSSCISIGACAVSSSSVSRTIPVNSTTWLMNEELEQKAAFKIKVPLSPSNKIPEDGKANIAILRKTEVEKEHVHSHQTSLGINSHIQESNHVKLFSGVKLSTILETPKQSTLNVFVPITEDMNKGFLGFTDDDTELTMLKEDPENLEHLAPTAGGVCVPLDETPTNYVLPDMSEEIMLSHCNLLSDSNNGDISLSPNSFISYKDELEPSSRPHSPILTQNENCNISFCNEDSPLRNHHILDFNLIHSSDDIDDLSEKTPSLMSLTLDQDPLLPFVTNDFMWGSSSSESSTWSSVSNSPSSSCSLSPHLDRTSNLAKLLTSESICNYDGGGKIGDSGGGDTEFRIENQRENTTRHQNVKNSISNISTKHIFNASADRITDRSISSPSYVKGNSFNRTNNDGSKNICNGKNNNININILRKDTNRNNINDQDKRKSVSDVVVGSKRALSENMNRSNSCKRSKQTTKTALVINRGRSSEGECSTRAEDSTTVTEAAAEIIQTNSVLMNLLVSGCDINAGYKEDYKEFVADRVCKKRNGNENRRPIDWPRLKKKFFGLLDPESTHIPSLMDLTEQDYAVNAPSSGELLQGSELLKALECPAVINLR